MIDGLCPGLDSAVHAEGSKLPLEDTNQAGIRQDRVTYLPFGEDLGGSGVGDGGRVLRSDRPAINRAARVLEAVGAELNADSMHPTLLRYAHGC